MEHPNQPSRRRLWRAGLVAGTAAGLAVTTLAMVSPTSAAVPVGVPNFPDNVVVFPDRDFVSVEGYSEFAGETATVKVTRAGSVIGSATAVVSDSGVAFEVNHPGGVCWGAGTGLNVTPDIKAGDVVSIELPDGRVEHTTTSSATVIKDMTKTGTTVTVEGTLGADVNPAQMEQRIINPDLVSVIGRRDVSAVPGPVTPSARGNYSSGISFNATSTTFTATYQFATQAAADTTAAADLGERAMSWEGEDGDGNRQGLTIAEFGEVGGPGFGGCPAGPGDQAAPTGAASVVRSTTTPSQAVLKWTPATPQPGADAVTGYQVEAVGAANATGDRALLGTRLGASATQTTLTGLDPAAAYTFEVRSMAGNKLSVPFLMGGPVDTTVPTLTLSPAGNGATPVPANSVTVSSNGQVFYTTDGSPAVSGDLPADNAKLYTGPIPITAANTELHVAAFDAAQNILTDVGLYSPDTAGLPAVPVAPAGLTAGAQTQTSVPLSWTASPASESVTGYQVTVYNVDGAKLTTQPPVTTVPRQTITGLTPGTTYQFSVAAKNAGGVGLDSAKITKATDAATDRITITSAKWKVNDFRVVGTGSQVGTTVQAYTVKADGTIGTAISGAAAQVVAAAPPGIGDYSIRLRANSPVNPGRIFVKSSGGGVAGPFTVANG